MVLAMRYISTRGQSAPQSFDEVLLAGLAPDGGLFLPESWPQFTAAQIAGFRGQPYAAVAYELLKSFTGDAFTETELRADIDAAYAAFDHPAVAPLSQIGPGRHLLELYHGPTLAFKDVALQILGRLFARALAKRGGKATVVAATSGDTGSAAIAALGDRENISVFVMHPKGRVSEVQRLQMTTAPFANVHNIALEGSFDDAQAIVKSLFADTTFARQISLTAVNSINFARIAAQIVYYFTASAALGEAATFLVPTGNFGDIFAAEAAQRMGLATKKLVIATNQNDILFRCLESGVYASGEARPSLSPSMDIQVASNFERALFEASGRDSNWLRAAMADFAKQRSLTLPDRVLTSLRARYDATRCDDTKTLATIKRVHQETGRLIDPHTAVAAAAAFDMPQSAAPMVILSTADPAKFPDAVMEASGITPPLPPRLAGLYEGVERLTTLPNNLAAIRDYIVSRQSV